MARRWVLFLFPTTHAVMQASQLLEEAGVAHDLVPRPRGVNADCGIAVALAPALRQEAAEVLDEGGCQPSRVVELEKPDPAPACRRRKTRDG
jgi:hypothetical protein